MIELIKPNTPDPSRLKELFDSVARRGHYTNHGPLVHELESSLQGFTAHQSMLYVANGTLAVQLALKAVVPKGKVLTTPYSYVATSNAILWQGLGLRFVDLGEGGFFPDPEKLEEAIDDSVTAILMTSVYGLPGPIERYKEIADAHGLPFILDAAHVFDVRWRGLRLDHWSDVACYSFHATKTFHTVEGGGFLLFCC